MGSRAFVPTLLLAASAAVALAAVAHAAQPEPPVAPPPAWIQWLGWSDDGRRMAWREGPHDRRPAPGQPLEIARLDEHGAVADHLHVAQDGRKALANRNIRLRKRAATQRVGTGDVLLQTSRGRLFAVAVRGDPASAAVLAKQSGGYEPVARWPVRSPAGLVEAEGYEDDAHRLVVLVVHTGTGLRRQAHLVVLPLDRPLPRSVPVAGGAGSEPARAEPEPPPESPPTRPPQPQPAPPPEPATPSAPSPAAKPRNPWIPGARP